MTKPKITKGKQFAYIGGQAISLEEYMADQQKRQHIRNVAQEARNLGRKARSYAQKASDARKKRDAEIRAYFNLMEDEEDE